MKTVIMPEDFQEKSSDKEEEDPLKKLRKKSSEYKPKDIEHEDWDDYEDIDREVFDRREQNGE